MLIPSKCRVSSRTYCLLTPSKSASRTCPAVIRVCRNPSTRTFEFTPRVVRICFATLILPKSQTPKEQIPANPLYQIQFVSFQNLTEHRHHPVSTSIISIISNIISVPYSKSHRFISIFSFQLI